MIVVAGTARSGTTFMAVRLARLLGGVYLHEPFSYWQDGLPGDDVRSAWTCEILGAVSDRLPTSLIARTACHFGRFVTTIGEPETDNFDAIVGLMRVYFASVPSAPLVKDIAFGPHMAVVTSSETVIVPTRSLADQALSIVYHNNWSYAGTLRELRTSGAIGGAYHDLYSIGAKHCAEDIAKLLAFLVVRHHIDELLYAKYRIPHMMVSIERLTTSPRTIGPLILSYCGIAECEEAFDATTSRVQAYGGMVPAVDTRPVIEAAHYVEARAKQLGLIWHGADTCELMSY